MKSGVNGMNELNRLKKLTSWPINLATNNCEICSRKCCLSGLHNGLRFFEGDCGCEEE